jgi:hypothetical protein
MLIVDDSDRRSNKDQSHRLGVDAVDQEAALQEKIEVARQEQLACGAEVPSWIPA